MELNTVIIETANKLGMALPVGRIHTTDAFYSADNFNARN